MNTHTVSVLSRYKYVFVTKFCCFIPVKGLFSLGFYRVLLYRCMNTVEYCKGVSFETQVSYWDRYLSFSNETNLILLLITTIPLNKDISDNNK